MEELDVNESFDIIQKNFKLKELVLSRYHKPTEFNVNLENEQLQLTDLKIDCFPLKEGKAAENFTKFIESQNQIKNFYFEDRRERIPESSGILWHILKLQSMESVEIYAKIGDLLNQFQSNQVKNPAVNKLIIREKLNSNLILYQYFKLFPKISNLQIHPESLTEENVWLINNLKNLDELSIDGLHMYILCKVSESILENIHVKNLKKLKLCATLVEKYPARNFKNLIENHLNLMELTIKMKYWIGLDTLEAIVKKLNNLKKLMISGLCDNEFKPNDKIFEIIGKNAKKLEYFELDLECCDKEAAKEFAGDAYTYFKTNLPMLKCNICGSFDQDFRV